MSDSIEERIKAIYSDYLNVICPYCMQLEIMDSTYPIEVFNEIRAITTHLARINTMDQDIAKLEYNLRAAESHVKRGILDCYKYLCVAYRDKYKEFKDLFKDVDLSVVNNGEFLPELMSFNSQISALVKKAKKAELKGDSTQDVYDAYQEAYNLSERLGLLIDSAYNYCERVRLVAKRKIIRDWIFGVVGIAGFIVGIIGIIIGFS